MPSREETETSSESTTPGGSVSVVGRHGTIATFNARRTSAGIKVKVTSGILEDFFKGLHGEGNTNYERAQRMPGKAYRLPNEVDTRDMTMAAWRPDLFVGGRVNLSFIRAVGIGDGYEFTVSAMMSVEEFDRWVNSASRAIKALYVAYMKPIEYRVVVTTEERS